jgi:hypothetical protein
MMQKIQQKNNGGTNGRNKRRKNTTELTAEINGGN